jgi:serine O-acetyltransferase
MPRSVASLIVYRVEMTGENDQDSMRFRIEAMGSRMTYDRDTVKEWAGNSQWRALQADYRRFRLFGYSGWGSEQFWAVAIYRTQRALRKSRTPWFWAPANMLLAVARKLLQIVTGLDLHPGAEIGAGLMILHGSQIRVWEGVKIGVDCVLGHVCTIGAGSTPGCANIGDHVYISPHSCILGPVTIGDGAKIAASSLVLSDVPAGHTAIGVPARILPRFKGPQPPRQYPDAELCEHRAMG